MNARSLVVALVLAALSVAGAAADSPAPRFTRERAVTPVGSGPNRLAVDVPILVGARSVRHAGSRVTGGLEDLRFYDPTGREVAWLRVDPSAPEERWEHGAILTVPTTKEASGFETDLGQVLRIDRLRLDGLPVPFLKRFRLEGSADREHWSVLVEDGTLFDLPEESLRRTTAVFPAGELRYLRVAWDDRSSAVLPAPRGIAVRVVDAAAVVPPTMVPLGFERRPSEPRTSRFRIHLPGSGLPIVALELSAGGDHLLRTARVTEPRLRGEELAPVALGTRTIRRSTRGDLVAADLRIPIGRPEGADLDLVVDDGDNPPLDLTAVRAELAPLPWIYFESAASTTLVARYGDPELGAPRYDLEAARAAIDPETVPTATWGDARELEPPPAAPERADAVPATVGGAIDPAPFRFARAIPAGPAGLVALVVDAAVLAHSRDLRDLRIADAASRQLPYLVERLGEPLAVALPAPEPIGGTERPGRISRYRLRLPYASLPASRLVLGTTGEIFERGVTVVAERDAPDARSEPRTQVLAAATWRHADPKRPAGKLVLDLPAEIGAAEIEVRVDEGDNAPLAISSPTLLLPGHRVRFFRPESEPLTLLYGNPELASPRYDLQILAPRVLRASAIEIAPAAEAATQAEARAQQTKDRGAWIFWGALLVAVAALVLVIARLVAEGPDPGLSNRRDAD